MPTSWRFRCAASAEKDDVEIAILRTDILMRDIIRETESSVYKTYLSDVSTFRHKLYPYYKANRTQPRPKHLLSCKEFLKEEWNAVIGSDLEADDLLGMNQTSDTIIASIDKDLLQVPGKHYNFVRKEFYTVTEQSGRYAFWYQMLVGDRTDNISGVDGIGDKTAKKILEGCITEEQYFDIVRDLYNNDDLMYLYGRLLWILRKKGELWKPMKELSLGINKLPHEVDLELDSTQT